MFLLHDTSRLCRDFAIRFRVEYALELLGTVFGHMNISWLV